MPSAAIKRDWTSVPPCGHRYLSMPNDPDSGRCWLGKDEHNEFMEHDFVPVAEPYDAGPLAPRKPYVRKLKSDAQPEFMRWTPASVGEPHVTDRQFAVLLISTEDGGQFLRPHYPGAKKPVPSDCYWIMLPPLPAAKSEHE